MDFSFYRQPRALLLEAVTQCWAIETGALSAILAGLQDPANFDSDAMGIYAQNERQNAETERVGKIALIPVHGALTPRRIPMLEMCGLTVAASTVAASVDKALDDSEIDAVLLSMDSPGGTVAGTLEAAQALTEMRANATKPIIAQVDFLCASGAYWLACAAAHEIVTAPSGVAGSIGVVSVYESYAAALEQQGVKVEFVTAGKYKAEINGVEPLSEEARGHVQSQVDYFYGLFTKVVAQARGASTSDVQNGYGQGRVLAADAALKANMVDRIDTMADTIQRLSKPQSRAAIMRRANPAALDAQQEAEAEEVAAPKIEAEVLENAVLADKLAAEFRRQIDGND